MKEYFSLVAGIASILGLAVALYQTHRVVKAIKVCFLLDIRRMVERIEHNKERFKTSDEQAYNELRDVQHDLETLDRKFRKQFSIEPLHTEESTNKTKLVQP
jgi:hypothetical protein